MQSHAQFLAPLANTINHNSVQNKQATILFCDIVDFTQRTLLLAPEQIAIEIRHFQQIISDAADMHNGHTASFVGDGCMVVFGHPRSTEQDAVNAIYCALQIQQNLQQRQKTEIKQGNLPIQVRMAIDTSMVCFTQPCNSSISLGQSMFGTAPNFASRLQQAAAPWQILVSQKTHKLTQPYFRFEKQAPLTLKGFPQPVIAWRVIGEQAPINTPHLHADHYLSEFTGRHQELKALRNLLTQSQSAQPQYVCITGEAGIGKSRLVNTFYRHLDRHTYYQVHLHCPKHGKATLFGPIRNEIYRWYRLQPNDAITRQQILLTQALSVQGINDLHSIALFFDLMAVPLPPHIPALKLSPHKKYRQILSLLSELLLRMTLQRPLILFIDNLNNADRATRDWIHHLSNTTGQNRLMLVCCSRNEHDTSLLPKNAHHLALSPLSKLHSRRLIRALLQGRQFEQLREQHISAFCDGIPLFIEEVCWNILWHLKQGELCSIANLADLPISDTLLPIFNSRIANLADAAPLASLAAVVNAPIPLATLSKLANTAGIESKHALQSLIKHKVLIPSEKKSHYCFRLKLMQQALYQSLTDEQRHNYHQLIAAQTLPEYSHNTVSTIAWHFHRSGNYNQAALHYLKAAKEQIKIDLLQKAFSSCQLGLNSLKNTELCFPHHETEIELELITNLLYCAWYNGQREHNQLSLLKRAAHMAKNLNRHDIAIKLASLRALYEVTFGISKNINPGLLYLRRREKNATHLSFSHQLLCMAKFISGQYHLADRLYNRAQSLCENQTSAHHCDNQIAALYQIFHVLNNLIMHSQYATDEKMIDIVRNLSTLAKHHRVEALLGLCIYFQLTNQTQKLAKYSQQAYCLATDNHLHGLTCMAHIFLCYAKSKQHPEHTLSFTLEKELRRCQHYYGLTLTAYFTYLHSLSKMHCNNLLAADISASDCLHIAMTTKEKWIIPAALQLRAQIAKKQQYSQRVIAQFKQQANETARQQHAHYFFKETVITTQFYLHKK